MSNQEKKELMEVVDKYVKEKHVEKVKKLFKSSRTLKIELTKNIEVENFLPDFDGLIPRACQQQITQTCKNSSPIKGAQMFLDKIVRHDNPATVQFLKTLVDNNQIDLLKKILKELDIDLDQALAQVRAQRETDQTRAEPQLNIQAHSSADGSKRQFNSNSFHSETSNRYEDGRYNVEGSTDFNSRSSMLSAQQPIDRSLGGSGSVHALNSNYTVAEAQSENMTSQARSVDNALSVDYAGSSIASQQMYSLSLPVDRQLMADIEVLFGSQANMHKQANQRRAQIERR